MALGSKKNSKTTKTATCCDDLCAKIERRAYELFEKRGYTHGNDMDDWLRAESQVKREMGVK